jgi:hypothetical protein
MAPRRTHERRSGATTTPNTHNRGYESAATPTYSPSRSISTRHSFSDTRVVS